MKRTPPAIHGKEGAITAPPSPSPGSPSHESKNSKKRGGRDTAEEPRSVLDHRGSPTPSLSGEVAALPDPPGWAPDWDVQPLGAADPVAMDDDWSSVLSDHPSPFLRWIASDPQSLQDPQQQHMLYDLDPSLLLEAPPDPLPLDPPLLLPQAHHLFLHDPLLPPFPSQQLFLPDEASAAVEKLARAAEQLEAGNAVEAHGILARLNHLSPLRGEPLLRSAFYFREALAAALLPPPQDLPRGAAPWDVVLRLSAHKAFAEASPVPQFAHLTCVQAMLEELAGCGRIHVVDLDVGVGGRWSSFLQELSQRRCGGGGSSPPSLRITAFVPPAAHRQLEMALVRDNLVQFAGDLGVPFEFSAHNVDSFELAVLGLSAGCNDGEALAVNLPATACQGATGQQLLRLVRQLSTRIVVCTDYCGGSSDRSELPFSQHLLRSLRSYSALLDSLDAANAGLDTSAKIGRFLLQPMIDNSLSGRYRGGGNKMLPWRANFASTGFSPLQLSSFTETQAECLLKRTPVRGFHVEKRQSSLVLFWQHEELASVSAWRC